MKSFGNQFDLRPRATEEEEVCLDTPIYKAYFY